MSYYLQSEQGLRFLYLVGDEGLKRFKTYFIVAKQRRKNEEQEKKIQERGAGVGERKIKDGMDGEMVGSLQLREKRPLWQEAM